MLSEFEQKKIDQMVGGLVTKRRPPAHIRSEVDLAYRLTNQSVEIFEIRPVWQGNGETHELPKAKVTFVKTQRIWKLFWQRQDLKWHGYEPLPQAQHLEELIAEIDADPYGCFWG